MKSWLFVFIVSLSSLGKFNITYAQSGSRQDYNERGQERIDWQFRVDTALQLQRQQAKPLIVFVTSPDCGYCRKMEADTWLEPKIVRELNQRFVTLKLDEGVQPDTVAKLGIKAFPTTIVYDARGRVVDVVEGYIGAAKLLTRLEPMTSP